jgi:hypothetical protein
VGRTKVFSTLLFGLSLTSALCAGCSSEGPDFPEVSGWTRLGEVLTYDADNLWEYINGAAELFVSYDVQSCRTTDLQSGDVAVTVDLYDMGTPLNAFGVFEREAYGETTEVPGAVDAVVSPPYQALLFKGSTYAKVNVFEGELTEAAGQELLSALAAGLPGETTLPPELNLLPDVGKVAGSESYQAKAFLGLTELTNCVFAEYTGEGDENWQGFVIVPDHAASVWETLSGEWESLDHAGSTVLFREVPYRGLVGVIRTDRGTFGVTGAEDAAVLVSRMESFIQ